MWLHAFQFLPARWPRALSASSWLAVVLVANTASAQRLVRGLGQGEGMPVARRFVVAIEARGDDGVRAGSGVILSPDGVIATAAHLVDGATEVQVRTAQDVMVPCEGWLYLDPELDLALIKVGATGLPAPKLKPGYVWAADGTRMLVIGSPPGLEQTTSEGLLSRVRADVDGIERMQLAMPEPPGSSGGAVVMPDGQLLGVVVSRTRGGGTKDTTFALPVGVAATALAVSSGRAPRPWSGVRTAREPLRAVVEGTGGWRYGSYAVDRHFEMVVDWPPSASRHAQRMPVPAPEASPLQRPSDVPEIVNDGLTFDWTAVDGGEKYDELRRGSIPTMAYLEFLIRWRVAPDTSGVVSAVSELSVTGRAAKGWFGGLKSVREYTRVSSMQLAAPGRITVDIRDAEGRDLKGADSSVRVVKRLSVTDTIAELWVDGIPRHRIWVPRGIILASDEAMAIAAIRNPLPDRFHLWLLYFENDTLALDMVRYARVGYGSLAGLGYHASVTAYQVPLARQGLSCEAKKTVMTSIPVTRLERSRGNSHSTMRVTASSPHMPLGGQYTWCVRANWRQ